MEIQIVTSDLIDQIQELDHKEQADWLFLEESEEFQGHWTVDGIYPEFFIDFEWLIGQYRLVSPATIAEFLEFADEFGYHVAFLEDPRQILDAYEYLNEPPNVVLNSNIPGNVNGFLPWQITGYNKLIRNEDIKLGYVVWLTGAGKTFFIASALKYHQEHGTPYDLALIVVRSHNKIDTQRKLKSLADIDSVLIEGDFMVTRQRNGEPTKVPGPRLRAYQEIEDRLNQKQPTVVVTNYEKLRDDREYFERMVLKRNCLFFWDEMPTKLSNRDTQLYKATRSVLYKKGRTPRTAWTRHWALTATPIENDPGDLFGCIDLVNYGFLGSKGTFNLKYVSSWNSFDKPRSWKNLDRLEAQMSFMTHRVSKDDPEVAKMFPHAIPMEKIIDWNPRHRNIYDKLQGNAKELIEELDDANVLAMIQVLQMVCDAPSMILQSAQNRDAFVRMKEEGLDVSPLGSDIAVKLLRHIGESSLTDKSHTKLEMWGEIIRKHDAKIVTHSTWAEYIFPVWKHYLDQEHISYVVYHGTPKEKQKALDAFRDDPSIKVFLSGDAGSTSIDIAEAQVGINYNIPWKWTTLTQREGRRDRVISTFDTIYTYTLIMPNSVDERKLAVCNKKFGYHQAIFDGKASEEALSANLTKEDLWYILFG